MASGRCASEDEGLQAAEWGATLSGDVVVREAIEAETGKL
jgi:hypothetical protein